MIITPELISATSPSADIYISALRQTADPFNDSERKIAILGKSTFKDFPSQTNSKVKRPFEKKESEGKKIHSVPLSISLRISPQLSSRNSPQSLVNALKNLREAIQADDQSGYRQLATKVGEDQLPLSCLKLSTKELDGIAPYLTYLDFGRDFDFSDWSENRLNCFLMLCNNVKSLSIYNSPIEVIPKKIANHLIHLVVENCHLLKALPEGMHRLTQLNCSRCQALESLPKDMLALESLRCNSASQLTKLPTMRSLTYLDCSFCKNLTDLPKVATNLTHLNCIYCEQLKKLPEKMSSLCSLNSSYCDKLSRLPDGMNSLEVLNCYGCSILTQLPTDMSSITRLNCKCCKNLETLPGEMGALVTLNCSACPSLKELPFGMTSLEYLYYKDSPLCSFLPDDLPIKTRINIDYI